MPAPTPAPRALAANAQAPAAPPAPLAKADVPRAAEVLARAFHDDPVMAWGIPDPAERARKLPHLFATLARYTQGHGAPFALGPGVDAAALWVPPGAYPTDEEALGRAGLAEWPARLGDATWGRFAAAMGLMDELHAKDQPGRHWYLWVLGVDPPRQGQGLGPRIVAPVLARADAEGLPAYLETFRPRNVPFYRKLGFEVVRQVAPEGGPTMWTMRRPPAPPARAGPGA